MITKKRIALLLTATSLSISSTVALAKEDTGIIAAITTAVPGWPLPLLLAFIIIFHKKIFSETEISVPEKTIDKPKKPVAEKKSETIVQEVTSEAVIPLVMSSDKGAIDLSDGKQCQASTAKKSRCKRKNTLKAINKVVDNKTYLFTICAQHNNDTFKPYPKLIK